MRKFVLAIAVLPLFSFAAHAADLPNTKAPPIFAPPPPPALTWTGFYIGANAGYGFGRSADFLTGGDPASQLFLSSGVIPAPFATSFRQAGVLGGGQIGYNWQLSNSFVTGIETDFDGARVGGHGFFVEDLGGVAPFQTNASRTLDWFGTVRARLGFLALPNLLLYGTGGLAYGETTASGNLVNAPPPGGIVDVSATAITPSGTFIFACNANSAPSTCYSGSGSRLSVGWSVGAGAEYRLTNNLSLKVEYLHVALAGQTVRMVSPSPPSSAGIFANARFDPEDVNIVRAGINYQFDLFAPPVSAKY